MAGLISVLNSNKEKISEFEKCFERAELFYKQNIKDELISRRVNAMHGCLSVLVVTRKNEQSRIFKDLSRGITVILDGNPQIQDKLIDASLMAKLFLEYGPAKMADMLDGGWVAIISDEATDHMFFFRDRIGLKPFYYSKKNDTLFTASNAGAMIYSGLVSNKYNNNIIAKYATSNYFAIYGREQSFFDDIRLIASGSFLQIYQNKMKQTKYWDLIPGAPYLETAAQELQNVYREKISLSVKNYLNSRNGSRYAVALSGGLDSGTILGLLHSITRNRVDAFSMFYEEETDFDESQLIECSKRDHANNWSGICFSSKSLLNDLSNIYNKYDIPISTVSIYGYDFLFRQSSQLNLGTVFTGAGGDAVLAGTYPCYLYNMADLRLAGSKRYLDELSSWIKNHSTKKYPKNKKIVQAFFNKHIDFKNPGSLKPSQILLDNNLLTEQFVEICGDLSATVVGNYGSYLRSYAKTQYLYHDVASGAEAEDTASWLYGSEWVSPFFAKDVVEYGWLIPPEYKIRNGINKYLARYALRGICPDEILDRVAKSGFNLPFDLWIRQSQIRDFAMDIFSSRSFRERGIYNIKHFQSLLEDHFKDRSNHMMLLWQALNLELWMREWVDRPFYTTGLL